MTSSPPHATGRSHWAELGTEARHPESAELDRLPVVEAVALLLREDQRGLEAAHQHAAEIARGAELLARTLADEGDVVLVGAGTSGRLAVLEAAECPPTFGTPPERIRAEIAGGSDAVFRASEGSEDREEDGFEVGRRLRERDLLVAVSASSVTPFALGALRGARKHGTATILVSCSAPEAVAGAADLVVALDTGPEILTGSTRLKAGSATKAALNAMTTAAMAQLGKIHENWMVDLSANSEKLVDRARRIVAEAGQVAQTEATVLLDRCGGRVKDAIVVALAGCSPDRANAALEASGGRIREAAKALEADGTDV